VTLLLVSFRRLLWTGRRACSRWRRPGL